MNCSLTDPSANHKGLAYPDRTWDDQPVPKRLTLMAQSALVEAVGTAIQAVAVNATARHADPRTTMRYDRARQNLDRHPNYILAAYMASGT
jgi:hypothetical protein